MLVTGTMCNVIKPTLHTHWNTYTIDAQNPLLYVLALERLRLLSGAPNLLTLM